MGICVSKTSKSSTNFADVSKISSDVRTDTIFFRPQQEFLSPICFPSSRLIRNKSQNIVPENGHLESPASHKRSRSKSILKTEKDVKLIESALQKHFIFSNLSENQIYVIINEMKLFTHSSQSIIFKQNSLGDYYFVIAAGKVEIMIDKEVIATMGPGESFGELALLHDAPRNATVIALEKTYLWGLSRSDFRNVLKSFNFQKYSENLRFIENFQFFKTLTSKQKETLSNCMHSQSFRKSDKIVQEGEIGNCMYFIKEGSVSITKKDVHIRNLLKNEYFGEQALFNNDLRTATVTAIENIVCLVLNKDDLQATLGSNLQELIHMNTQKMAFNSEQLLNNLTEAQVNQVIAKSKIVKFLANALAFAANKKVNSIFIVLTGRIEGKTNKFKTLDFLSIEPLFHDFSFKENLVAVEDSDVAEITVKDFENQIDGKVEQVLERNSIVKIIKDMKVFKSLSEPNLQKLAKMLNLVRFRTGSVIFAEETSGNSFYIIKKGNVEIRKKNAVVREIGRFDYFGERSLLFQNRRSATTIAKTDVECWTLTNAQFSSVIDDQMRIRLLERIQMQDVDINIKDLCFVKVMAQNKNSTHFLCINPENSKLYILKSMQKNRFINEQDQTNLIHSKKLMLLVDHYFMVRLLKTYKDSIRLCMLFEYIPGVPFMDILETDKQSLEVNARFYIACLIIILEYLHNRDIILRYISLSSVMIDTQGYPVLVDFSCAKMIQGRTYSLIGPPHYLPPEVIIGEGYGTSADLWGLGISLYYMIFRKYPFGNNENDPIQIYQEALNCRLVFPSTVDPLSKARNLLCDLLNKKSSLRGSIEKVKRHSWFLGLNWDLLTNKQLRAPYLPHPTEIDKDVKAALKTPKIISETFASYESGPESYICRLNLNKNWDSEF